MQVIISPTLRQQLESMQSNPFEERLGTGHFACFLDTKPWGDSCGKYSHALPVKNCFTVCYSPVGLVNASSVGYQIQLSLGQHKQKMGCPACAQSPSRDRLATWCTVRGSWRKESGIHDYQLPWVPWRITTSPYMCEARLSGCKV